MSKDILEVLKGKRKDGTSLKDIFDNRIAAKPEDHVDTIIEGLASSDRNVQNGCAELASLVSEKTPDLLISSLALFVENLSAKEPMLRWEAVCTVGNLAKLDKKGVIVNQLPTLYGLLNDKSIVLQGHALKALAKIAHSNPDQAEFILKAILDAEDRFPGNRIGFVVEAMEVFIENRRFQKKIRTFVHPLAGSAINSVSRKAKKVLKLLDKLES